ncbi:MAG: FecR family protein [Myxococcales bacterium]|nr:FecR family protein [Myxococcales bacterium]
MRHAKPSFPFTLAAALLVLLGCSDPPPPETPAAEAPPPPAPEPEPEAAVDPDAVDPAALVDEVGVEPGGLEAEADSGAAAVVAFAVGGVEVRRTGEEAFAAFSVDAPELRAGDQLQTGSDGAALLLLSDGTEVELAEDSAIAIGDRDAGTAPASAVAVLVGVARFTVSTRAEGEGAFVVYTAGGAVGAVGTAFTVGVAATGSIRVGVEEGSVEVAGVADLDQSTALDAGKAVDIDATGKVSPSAELQADAWGDWRDEAESKIAIEAAVDIQLAGLSRAEAQTEATYRLMEKLSEETEKSAAEAEAFEQADDQAGYAAGAEGRAVALEAGLLASLRLQHLTFAMLSHAHIARGLHRRHPEKLAARIKPEKKRLAKALLYHKKFHVTAHQRIRPMRGHYCKHHPEGRKLAKALGQEVPAFYLKTKLPPPGQEKARERAELALLRPPKVKKHDKKRKLRREGPEPNWHAAAIAKVRAARKLDEPEEAQEEAQEGKEGKKAHGRKFARFYHKPEHPKAKMLAGLAPKVDQERVFKPAGRKPLGRVNLGWAKRKGPSMPRAIREARLRGANADKGLPPGLAKPPGEPAEGRGAKVAEEAKAKAKGEHEGHGKGHGRGRPERADAPTPPGAAGPAVPDKPEGKGKGRDDNEPGKGHGGDKPGKGHEGHGKHKGHEH